MSHGGEQLVCIARHGDRLDFADPEWHRTAARPWDPPLSPLGVEQAEELGQRLTREAVAHVFSSPFLRTAQTAQAVAQALGLPVNIEPGLSEWLSAEWFPEPPELLSLDRLAKEFPRIDPLYAPRGAAAHGETGEAALARSGATVVRLVAEFAGNIVLIGHGASVLGATACLLGRSAAETERLLQPLRPCCLIKLARRPGEEWRLELDGSVDHLTHAETDVRFV